MQVVEDVRNDDTEQLSLTRMLYYLPSSHVMVNIFYKVTKILVCGA